MIGGFVEESFVEQRGKQVSFHVCGGGLYLTELVILMMRD